MTDASTTGADFYCKGDIQLGTGCRKCARCFAAAIQRAEAAEAQAALAWEAGRDAAAGEVARYMIGAGAGSGQFHRLNQEMAAAIRALTPPADLSAALTARLDAEWNAAIEAAAMKSYGTGWANRIRALRRAAPTEGEA